MTATPSAPATCRTVFWTAEPAPARASGSTFCITVEAGATTAPIPSPKRKKYSSASHTGVVRPSVLTPNSAAATTSSPVVITGL